MAKPENQPASARASTGAADCRVPVGVGCLPAQQLVWAGGFSWPGSGTVRLTEERTDGKPERQLPRFRRAMPNRWPRRVSCPSPCPAPCHREACQTESNRCLRRVSAGVARTRPPRCRGVASAARWADGDQSRVELPFLRVLDGRRHARGDVPQRRAPTRPRLPGQQQDRVRDEMTPTLRQFLLASPCRLCKECCHACCQPGRP